MVAELNSSNAVTLRYTLGGTEVLAQKAGTGAGVPFNFLLHDGQGNTRSLVDNNGATPENYIYDAFGTLTPQIAAPKTRYLYAGQQFDTATGLYNLRARYYNSMQGRFLSRDSASISFDSPIELNRYAYTANNPTNGYDPTGTIGEGYQLSEEQSEAHRDFVTGKSASRGLDSVELATSSLLAAMAARIDVTLLQSSILDKIVRDSRGAYTLGVGISIDLQTNIPETLVSLNRFQWGKLAFDMGGLGTPNLIAQIKSLISEPNVVIYRSDIPRDTIFLGNEHAEEIIAKYANSHYEFGAGENKRVPYRMLAMDATRGACSDNYSIPSQPYRQFLSCSAIYLTNKILHPLLYESTVFVNLGEGYFNGESN